MSGRVTGRHGSRQGQLVLAALLLSGFVVFLLAMFRPEWAIIPSVLLTGWVVVSARGDRHAARKVVPCSICGARYAGADMVEHHIRDHRECSS